MRKALLTLLFLPLFTRSVIDPVPQGPPPAAPPPSFNLQVHEPPVERPPDGSVLLLPLTDGAGDFRLTSARDGVMFDIDGDGDRDQVGWPERGTDVAFLALDANGDGRITSGTELFGAQTRPGAKNGCTALLDMVKASGAPSSGSIHEGHALYDKLVLWVDVNHNGISEAGELRRARDAFTAIGLGYERLRWRDEPGNRLRYRGWMERRTAGASQGRAAGLVEEALRLRHYYEVALTVQ